MTSPIYAELTSALGRVLDAYDTLDNVLDWLELSAGDKREQKRAYAERQAAMAVCQKALQSNPV
jgi:hypothetical protein